MIRIYGSHQCPDCVACKANFDEYGIAYEFLDVLSDLHLLRDFLIYRDTKPEVFDRLKAIHDIGLPACIDEDGTVFTDWETYLKKQGLTPFFPETTQSACSLDRKGC